MTPKQIERIQKKIKKIKAEMAADKKRWGGVHDDSRGLRYLPPELYIKIEDYTGGLRYINWFDKNFPDDMGFPIFLFEWALILFKKNRIDEAEAKVIAVFNLNPYVLDTFLGNPIEKFPINHWSPITTPEYAGECLNYSHTQPNCIDFADWLQVFIQRAKFQEAKMRRIQKGSYKLK